MRVVMRLIRITLVPAVVIIIVSAGCMLFNDIRVPERVLVDNSGLPPLESADFLQASLRFQPEKPDIATRLEMEAGIDRAVWSIRIQQAMSGISSQIGSAQARLHTTVQGSVNGAGQEDAHTSYREAMQRAGRDAVRSNGNRQNSLISNYTGDLILSEYLNRITEQVRRVAWNGHVFYFISTAIDTPVKDHSGVQYESTDYDDPSRYHTVYVLDEDGRGVASFRTEKVQPMHVADGLPRSLPSQPLQYDIVVTDDCPWILYRDKGGIYARPLVFYGRRFSSSGHSSVRGAGRLSGGRGSFSFGEARLIARADDPYGDFQFVSRVDDRGSFHTIWTDSRTKNDLWYCRYDPQMDEICRRPRRLSRSASAAPVNLMIQGDQVYVSWIDNRYTRGLWTKRNFAKLFMAKSDDRGVSFGSPISINPPRDNSENVGYSVTLPASGEGVLIFWGTKWMGSGAHNQDLYYGWLHPDMKRVYVGENTIPGARLVETAEYEMLDYHRSLGNR